MKGWTYPTSDSPRITVRNLLTHTAGFVEDNPWGDRQQVMTEPEFTAALKAGVPFSRAPGLAMEYSNFGYAALGRIISNVSGTRYQDYIRREIMAPLGMTSTTYDVFTSPPNRRAIGYRWQGKAWVREPDMKDGAFGAMGGVETSANDFAKWVAFLLSAWPARDGPELGPIRRSTVREIVTGDNFASAQWRNVAIGGAPCRQASTYAMAWGVVDDCDLGRVVSHSGGYPGYGSIVMLLPDKGVGLFAFSSRTYGGPSLPAFRAALALNKAGAFDERTLAVSPGLATAYGAAKAVWNSGSIAAAPLANNVLMDRSAEAWNAMISGVKAEVGGCATDSPIIPISAMEGRFNWNCATGRLSGRVQRAPTTAVTIQALEFAPARP
jgi:CubicO group peptidase (beta-lactamase class C family)